MMKYLFLGMELLFVFIVFAILVILLNYINNKLFHNDFSIKNIYSSLLWEFILKSGIYVIAMLFLILLFFNSYFENDVLIFFFFLIALVTIVFIGNNMLFISSEAYLENFRCVLKSFIIFFDNILLISSVIVTFLYFIKADNSWFFSILTAFVFYLFTEFSRIYYDEKKNYNMKLGVCDYVNAFFTNIIVTILLLQPLVLVSSDILITSNMDIFDLFNFFVRLCIFCVIYILITYLKQLIFKYVKE